MPGLASFPRRFVALAAMLGACSLALGLTALQQDDPGDNTSQAERTVIPIALGLESHPAQTIDGDTWHSTPANSQPASKNVRATAIATPPITERAKPGNAAEPLAASPAVSTAELAGPPSPLPPTRVVTEKLGNGDSLSLVFNRVGLSGRDVYEIVSSGSEGAALKKIFPGESLLFELDQNGKLITLTRVVSPLKSVHFARQPDEAEIFFASETVERVPETRQVTRSAQISSSLSLAADRAQLPAGITMTMANIFGGVIDFVYDVRAGDSFAVIYEEHYLDGRKIDNGNIIAAQYINRGKIYNAYRYSDASGNIGYYNEDGVSMRKAFLRAPLDFTRISSGFNLRRLHPITKNVRPHRGIDYAAPTGTPVFSTGDGRVLASGYSKANGKYVFIRHGEAYTTKYLHLSKRAVKKGQRIKQGQIIGHVGCTGMCTGPHLHYEFLVNGVHRNPRTILKKLPKAKSLDSQYKDDFVRSIRPLQLQIASLSDRTIELADARE